jgi:GTP-binding protein
MPLAAARARMGGFGYYRSMSLPLVVIVGRPNVGKSSLLNALARERISIVDPRPGITRDRVTAVIEYGDRYFELVDTGGIGIIDDDHLEAHVEEQIRFAIERADVIVFVVDVMTGITPLDQKVAELLRRAEKPVVVVANKADDPKHEPEAGQFARLGHGEAVCMSALHALGRDALLERLLPLLPPVMEEPGAPVMRG